LTEGQKRLQRLKEEKATFNPWGTSYSLNFVKANDEKVKKQRVAGSPTKRVLEDPITHRPYKI